MDRIYEHNTNNITQTQIWSERFFPEKDGCPLSWHLPYQEKPVFQNYKKGLK